MNVAQLLERIVDIYPGANPQALASFRPVFFARLQHREGPKLEDAANEVFASFQPKASKPFPIPVDFEAHLPSLPKAGSAGAEGPPIRDALEARVARSKKLYAAWVNDQGRKIKEARHMHVYGACALAVMRMCRKANDRTQRIILTAEQIAICEMRALTAERAHRGPPPEKLSPEAWQAQIDQIRAEWSTPPQEKERAA